MLHYNWKETAWTLLPPPATAAGTSGMLLLAHLFINPPLFLFFFLSVAPLSLCLWHHVFQEQATLQNVSFFIFLICNTHIKPYYVSVVRLVSSYTTVSALRNNEMQCCISNVSIALQPLSHNATLLLFSFFAFLLSIKCQSAKFYFSICIKCAHTV